MLLAQSAIPSGDLPLVLTVLLKLGLGVLLGGLIGYERELHGRPAGIRTHMLVVLGVILFAEVSKAFGSGDPGRIAAQIVTGIGFLGAGTILRFGAEVRGLTTAASLWAVAGIGMAVSAGGPFLVIAMAASVLTLITLSVVTSIERRLVPTAHPRTLEVKFADSSALQALMAELAKSGCNVRSVRISGSGPDSTAHFTFHSDSEDPMAAAASVKGVTESTWTD